MFKRFFGGADAGAGSGDSETIDDEIKFGAIEWIDADTFKTPLACV